MLNSLFSISNRNSFKRSKIKWYPSTQDVYKRIAKTTTTTTTTKKNTEIENLATKLHESSYGENIGIGSQLL